MPHTYSRTFRVRFHECDAYGHLHSANFLRWMQETAFDASSDAGYDWAKYESMNRLWIIRESCVDFLRPVHYGEEVEIKTWVADFRRASSRRRYEFRLAGTNNRLANAYTDWVFVDSQNYLPAAIPEKLIKAFLPEGTPESNHRQPFPTTPTRPDGAYQMHYRVGWNDIDSLQHVNNAIYLNYLTECSFQSLAAYGWPFQRWLEQKIGIFLRRLQIQYLQPALMGDELEIATWFCALRRASALRYYTISRANDMAKLARAQTCSVWVNTTNQKILPIPKQMLEDTEPMIVRQAPLAGAFQCPF